jgi:hypothetical protein
MLLFDNIVVGSNDGLVVTVGMLDGKLVTVGKLDMLGV